VRLAYADPPYPGQAKRLYGNHPDFAGEVDHAELVLRLDTFDGWALSTNAVSLQYVLGLCPQGVRIASWQVQNSAPPGSRGTWWWSWEALILKPARAPVVPTRDYLSSPTLGGFMGGRITGEKPVGFCEWLFALIGAEQDDDFTDLFPGSGAVTEAWSRWSTQMNLNPPRNRFRKVDYLKRPPLIAGELT
jgi:hypothetical protein